MYILYIYIYIYIFVCRGPIFSAKLGGPGLEVRESEKEVQGNSGMLFRNNNQVMMNLDVNGELQTMIRPLELQDLK